MVVANNLDAINKLGQLMTSGNTSKKENKLAVGQKKVASDDAASLTLTENLRQKMKVAQGADDIVTENILASESNYMDITKADEMIRQANSKILDQADDAMKVQADQSTISVMELLR